MNPEQLSSAIAAAIAQANADGVLAVPVPQAVPLDRPRSRDHGDYATPVALQLAKAAGQPPHQLAEILQPYLERIDGLAQVQIAGPGFLNITLETGAAGALVGQILAAADTYGTSQRMAGRSINLEFVSGNPTGPIHLGGARWAAVGDVLGRIFTSQGAAVTREYYFNDAGAQIDRFATSLLAVARHQPVDEDGYVGEYIVEIAARIVADHPHATELSDEQAQEVFRTAGVALMFAEIKQTLHEFGTDFDVYFHEDSLHKSGAVDAAVARLKESGDLEFADGAWWLKSTAFGDDKDRVVIKSDGRPAYVAGDLAYFLDKRSRGFDLCIYMLGADHHGYIARLKAAAAAFGDDPDTVEVMIGQMVHLMSDGQIVRMSKRAGNVLTLDDLMANLGVDAARYALCRYSVDTTLMLDIAEWTRQTNDNPVFYVQYAHARLASIARNAAELGIIRAAEYDPSLLDTASEQALIAQLAAYPRIVATAADLREPHRVCRYLEDLAAAYHKFYDAVRVLPMGEESAGPATHARLALCAATQQVLANGLAMLGVSAPERM